MTPPAADTDDPSKLLDGIGWTAAGDWKPTERRIPFIPRLKHIPLILPMVWRFFVKSVYNWWNGEGIFINIFKQNLHMAHTGVPIGGIGCGSIGRDFRGAFNRFSLVPGLKELWVDNIRANQFILTVRSVTGQLLTQRLLTCAKQDKSTLHAWDKTFPTSSVRYRGLFPRSWTEYELPDLGLTLVCEQISPVIPHDYKDSTLPVANFVWRVKNSSTADYNISIAFTWRNGTGCAQWAQESVCRVNRYSDSHIDGMELANKIRGKNVTYGVYAKRNEKRLSISSTSFDPTTDGGPLWRALGEDGNLQGYDRLLDGYRECAVAVCAETQVVSSECGEIEFALVWNMPEIDFGKKSKECKRRFSRFFHGPSATSAMGAHAVKQRKNWQRQIEEWQQPVIADRRLPEWYRSALFNELYYVADGSTSWIEYDAKEDHVSEHTAKHMKEWGRFGYMESWEYLMYNTYDVHFYASAAFIENWPQLEVSMQLDFSEQLNREDTRLHKTLMDGETVIVKKRGRLPHDMGHPIDSPWEYTNTYCLHDTCEWKDLNLKFILASLRDYQQSIKTENPKATEVLAHLFERSMEIIEAGKKEWDVDGDGMIENGGFADQTYDVWIMTGTSSYCGSLWIAALEAARRMAEILGRKTEEASLAQQVDKARSIFIKKLWNGRYFNFDETSSSIMADQLCGVWFMAALDGTTDKMLIDKEKVSSVLDTIFANNVKKFGSKESAGKSGAANGWKEDSGLDTTAIQSEEMWTGTTYALASFFALMGDRERCFAVAEGVYDSCWKRAGLQYQTPEAMFQWMFYRAIGYMRPLAIWNIHAALRNTESLRNYELDSTSGESSS
ncbi:hypothetical protein PRIPAC_74608 [Pristionchus pacificus]|uniref:Non-lysosomal glucosylceramidase n=1 Tax=Pristionchus pacificus TaxID=54126 RepID=A0A454XVJ1_PRIPA|nr:hypothetical protein PRIPAC_74608 [Pristionchus pacificus]|eukprot:PDM73688.1 hypothetical protein PRIPAC_41044 [Pristionchus pacificus]